MSFCSPHSFHPGLARGATSGNGGPLLVLVLVLVSMFVFVFVAVSEFGAGVEPNGRAGVFDEDGAERSVPVARPSGVVGNAGMGLVEARLNKGDATAVDAETDVRGREVGGFRPPLPPPPPPSLTAKGGDEKEGLTAGPRAEAAEVVRVLVGAGRISVGSELCVAPDKEGRA